MNRYWSAFREVGIQIGFWPFEWRIGVLNHSDDFVRVIDIAFGPFGVVLQSFRDIRS